MSLFGCRTCKSKDTEIEFLRDQVRTLQDKALNMADNHLQARLEASKHVPPRPDAPDKPKGPPASGAKRYQHVRSREDRPVPRTPEELELQTKILDAEFKAAES